MDLYVLLTMQGHFRVVGYSLDLYVLLTVEGHTRVVGYTLDVYVLLTAQGHFKTGVLVKKGSRTVYGSKQFFSGDTRLTMMSVARPSQ